MYPEYESKLSCKCIAFIQENGAQIGKKINKKEYFCRSKNHSPLKYIYFFIFRQTLVSVH